MEEVKYEDLRVGSFIRVVHKYEENGPVLPFEREYVGKITTVNAKWLKVTRKKKEVIVPQVNIIATETIYRLTPEEYKEYK